MTTRRAPHDALLSLGVLLAGCTLVVGCWAWALTGTPTPDYTDTGVGCIDCLDIQDEAQTTESITRN